MKKILTALGLSSLVLLGSWSLAGAVSVFITSQGGTGTSTPSGILYGDNGVTTSLKTVTVGSGLSFSSGTLTATGGSGTVTSITAGTGLLGGTITTSGTISGTLATSSIPTVGQLAYWTGDGTPSTIGSVATGTISSSGGITTTAGRSAVGGALVISCDVASGSQAGCLASADWTTFNNKQATISTTWPITLSGATIGFNGLSTSTAAVVGNIPYFSGVNTFANVATGTASCTTGASCSSFTVIGSSPSITTTLGTSVDLASEVTGTLPVFNGGTGTTTAPVSQLLYGGSGVYQSVATTSVTCSGSTTCTSFTAIGGSPITISSTGGSGIEDPFTHTSVFGQTTSATSTLLALTGSPVSLAASSTAWFDQINVGSTTLSTMATSTFFGSINVVGIASSTSILIGAGAVGAPSIALADNNTGFYSSSGPGFIDTAINGTNTFRFSGNNFSSIQSTGRIISSVGSASSPSFGFSGTTGGVFGGSGILGFSSAGVEAGRFDSSQRFGIGTTSPSQLLSVHGDALFSGNLSLANLTATGTIQAILGLTIPALASPTLDVVGKIALDTTSNNFVLATSTTGHVVIGGATTTLYAFTVASTSADWVSGGIIEMPSHFLPQVVTGLICDADAGTSVVVNLSDGTNDTNAITCTTTETQFALTSNNSFTAYEDIRLEIGTITGSVDRVSLRFIGYRVSD